jgi:predicted ATPase/DNA-binding winged helix-turn-helix (wHTH) protein
MSGSIRPTGLQTVELRLGCIDGWKMATGPVVRTISFGPFRLFPDQRLLIEGDRPIRVGSRALDVLIALVQHPGELVTKNDLFAHVWPAIAVEESNLRVHLASLRRTLNDGRGGNRYIVNIPGRGYRFVAPVSITESTSAPRSGNCLHNLPATLTRLIGRGDVICGLTEQLPGQRLITLVGTGGVGTTSVALATAEAMFTCYEDGVWLADLSPLANAGLVPTTVAAAVRLNLCNDDVTLGLISAVRDKQILLVLDNCDRVIESAADLAVAILKNAPRANVLATSREPLRADGEHVHRLPPLRCPPLDLQLTADEALGFPAIELFVERATASAAEFEFDDASVRHVSNICSRLDGVPLAIEFAAARVDAFGLKALASGLDDRFQLLTRGRRTAVPRHQSMRATLDWSYDCLSEIERLLLQRLAVFAGPFSFEAASAVAAHDQVVVREIADYMADLVAKSLVTADVSGPVVRYRLLETTRAYAIEKLTHSGDYNLFARRHAEYYRHLLELAAARGKPTPSESLEDNGSYLDQARAALDWAFSQNGDVSLGVALTAAAVPLWFDLSLMSEARHRIEQAILSIEPTSDRAVYHELQLVAALGGSLLFTTGSPEIATAWTKAIELANSLDNAEYRLQALWGLWAYRITCGKYRSALALAHEFRHIAENNDVAEDLCIIGDRMVGVVLHFMGDQREARGHIDRMLKLYKGPTLRTQPIRFPIEQRLAARTVLARILWLQGFPEQAIRTAQHAVDEGIALNHPMSLCYALGVAACPVMLFVGDLPAAQSSVAMLLDRSARHGLTYWNAWGRSFSAALAIRHGKSVLELQVLQETLYELRATKSALRHLALAAELAEASARFGLCRQGLSAIDEALERTEECEERWSLPELLRIKGELLLLEGKNNALPAAAELFEQALALARRQGALSWELRTSISVARLRRNQGSSREAYNLLAPVYGRFTEGFETADLLTAKHVLEQLNPRSRATCAQEQGRKLGGAH